jgi:hypothetical protein
MSNHTDKMYILNHLLVENTFEIPKTLLSEQIKITQPLHI